MISVSGTILRLAVLIACLVEGAAAAAQTPSLTGPSVTPITLTEAGAIAEVSAPRIALADEPASCGSVPSRPVSVDGLGPTAGLRVYPNPLARRGSVELPATDLASALHLIDPLGRRVWFGAYAAGTGNPVHLQLPALPPGVYLLQWRVNGITRATERVVVGH